MKRAAIGIAAILALAFVAGFWSTGDARADNGPHVKGQLMTTSACASCHRAHTAQGAYLLKVPQEQLCASCHEGGSGATTDPFNGTTSTGGALRAGGFNNALINSADPTWRFSVECTVPDPVPGYPAVPCTNAFGTAWASGSAQRITFCGSGDTIPALPNNNATITTSNTAGGQCNITNTAGLLQDPATWFLTILPGTSAPTTSNHTVGVAAKTVWGSGPMSASAFNGSAVGELECANCHDPHGNGQYRILRPNPAGELSGTPALTGTFPGGVTVPDDCPSYTLFSGSTAQHSCANGTKVPYTTTNYMDSTYVKYTEGQLTATTYQDGMAPATATETGISAWCAQCHQRYLGRGVYATDSGDAVFRFRHSTEGTPGYSGRQCNTCHVAHGTNATGTATTTSAGLAGDTALLKMNNRGMCQKCHRR